MSVKSYLAAMESAIKGNPTDFTRVRSATPNPTTPKDAERSGMFKLVATASNLHLAIADFYQARGEQSKSNFHTEIANRLRAESNKLKNE